MMDERLRRGLESYVAAFLREHVAPAILQREEFRRSLGTEGLDRVRREVMTRLEMAEQWGFEDRESVREFLSSLWRVAISTPGGSALQTLLKSWFDEHLPTGRASR